MIWMLSTPGSPYGGSSLQCVQRNLKLRRVVMTAWKALARRRIKCLHWAGGIVCASQPLSHEPKKNSTTMDSRAAATMATLRG